MSAARRRLEHPAVVGIVALGIVGVAALNFWMFGEGRSAYADRAADLSDPNAQGLESLGYLMSQVDTGEAVTSPAPEQRAGFEWPRKARDPFSGTIETVAVATEGIADSAARRCDAVVLRGSDPIALIDGLAYRIGQAVGGAVVVAIDEGGVTLLDGERRKQLALSDEVSGPEAFAVVTANPKDGRPDGTGSQSPSDQGGKE